MYEVPLRQGGGGGCRGAGKEARRRKSGMGRRSAGPRGAKCSSAPADGVRRVRAAGVAFSRSAGIPPPGPRGWRRVRRRCLRCLWPDHGSRARGACNGATQGRRDSAAGEGSRPRRSRAGVPTMLGDGLAQEYRQIFPTAAWPRDRPRIYDDGPLAQISLSNRSRFQKPGASHLAGRRRSSETSRQAPLSTPNRRARRRMSREVAGGRVALTDCGNKGACRRGAWGGFVRFRQMRGSRMRRTGIASWEIWRGSKWEGQ